MVALGRPLFSLRLDPKSSGASRLTKAGFRNGDSLSDEEPFYGLYDVKAPLIQSGAFVCKRVPLASNGVGKAAINTQVLSGHVPSTI